MTMPDSTSSAKTYRVEVELTKTGVVTVEAEDFQSARKNAKAAAREDVSLNLAHVLTNNIRAVEGGEE